MSTRTVYDEESISLVKQLRHISPELYRASAGEMIRIVQDLTKFKSRIEVERRRAMKIGVDIDAIPRTPTLAIGLNKHLLAR